MVLDVGVDLTNFKVIETRPIDLPYSDLRGDLAYKTWAVSADGRRLVLTGLKEGRTKTTSVSSMRPTPNQSYEFGKQRAENSHANMVLAADWSKDGRALYVFSANGRSVSLWKLIED